MTKTGTASNQPLLCATDLFCERDERVLFRNLSFELFPGQVLQVRGSNGSGKTTLLRILCGLNQGYEGSISWRGADVAEHVEDFRGDLLYIGHRNGVNKVLTPLENLRWGCSLQQRVSDGELEAALKQVGLFGFEYSQCFTLSAGQQQRVSLARLILSRARLWVLDEPFTTLDANAVAQVESLIAAHAAGGGAALVTTHHPLAIPGLHVLDLD